MLERTGQERKLLAPTAPRLLTPDQRVERMQLAFVISGFALDAQRLERAVQASGVIEKRVSSADWDEETGQGAVGGLPPLEYVQRIHEVELAGSRVVQRYAQRRGIPYVFGLSSDVDTDLLFESRQNLASPQGLLRRLLLMPYYLWLDASMRRLQSRADRVIVQHEGQAAALAGRVRRAPVLLRTMHRELDRAPVKAEGKTVLWVANRPYPTAQTRHPETRVFRWPSRSPRNPPARKSRTTP